MTKASSMIGLCFLLACSLEDSNPQGLSSGSETLFQSDRPFAKLGESVSLLGDFNGDGFSEVAIGGPGHNQNGVNAGAVYFFGGSASGPNTEPDAVILGGPQDEFGLQIISLGDINRDGFFDFAVRAAQSSRLGILRRPVVHIFLGSSQGILKTAEERTNKTRMAETADWILQHDAASSASGPFHFQILGDIDQNGGLDFALSDVGQRRLYLFLFGDSHPSSTRLLTSNASTVIQGNSSYEFGTSFSWVGDVNGENRGLRSWFGDDFLMGAPHKNQKGRAFLIHGRASFPRGSVALENLSPTIFEGDEEGDQFGSSVAGLGDFDGDGFEDLAIGSPLEKNRGRVRVYRGEAIQGPNPDLPPIIFEGEREGDQFGFSITGLLPLGVLGVFPLVVGAYGNSFSGTGAGAIYLFSNKIFGSSQGVQGVFARSDFADIRFLSPLSGLGAARFGRAVHGGLDINGDQEGDLVWGAPEAFTAGTSAGLAGVEW